MNLKIGNFEYETSGKLSTFEQLHLVRKLGPAIPMVQGLTDLQNSDKPKALLVVLMLSRIDDQSVDYIMRQCLSVVRRKQAVGPSAKVTTPDGTLMFDDIDLSSIMQLTVAVIEENVGDFFRTALATLPAESE